MVLHERGDVVKKLAAICFALLVVVVAIPILAADDESEKNLMLHNADAMEVCENLAATEGIDAEFQFRFLKHQYGWSVSSDWNPSGEEKILYERWLSHVQHLCPCIAHEGDTWPCCPVCGHAPPHPFDVGDEPYGAHQGHDSDCPLKAELQSRGLRTY